MSFIWLADSLYATAPFIQNILDAGEDYLFRVKQGDHKKLFEMIETAPYESLKKSGENSKTTIAHRWYKNIPLNGVDGYLNPPKDGAGFRVSKLN